MNKKILLSLILVALIAGAGYYFITADTGKLKGYFTKSPVKDYSAEMTYKEPKKPCSLHLYSKSSSSKQETLIWTYEGDCPEAKSFYLAEASSEKEIKKFDPEKKIKDQGMKSIPIAKGSADVYFVQKDSDYHYFILTENNSKTKSNYVLVQKIVLDPPVGLNVVKFGNEKLNKNTVNLSVGLTLSWSQDPLAVKYYVYHKDGIVKDVPYKAKLTSWKKSEVKNAEFTYYGGVLGASHSFVVIAVDNDNLESAPSDVVSYTFQN